jgi:hypothetical protein
MAELWPTKTMLLHAYKEATIIYSGAVLLDPTRTADYAYLFRLAEQAHEKVTVAREELHKHVNEHGC